MADVLDKDEGTPCRSCGAELHKADPQPSRVFRRLFAEPLHLTTYECEGPERHRWTYTILQFDPTAGVGTWKLIPEAEFVEGVVPPTT